MNEMTANMYVISNLTFLNSEESVIKCRDIMTEDPFVVSTSTPITDVARTMVDKRINSVLINNSEGKVVGIFTSTDALKLLANQ